MSLGGNLFIMGNDCPAALSRDPSPNAAARSITESELGIVPNHVKSSEDYCNTPRSRRQSDCNPLLLLETALESCGYDIEFLDEVMIAFFLSSGVILKNLETFYRGKLYPEMLRALENLRTSSELLGFISISQKAKRFMVFLSQDTASDGDIFFASKLSDLNLDLRLGHSEWFRARETLESPEPPQQERLVAVCHRR
uniref:Uncharacterized protein n=1 Tax=Cryptomonas curvata TaxID=233186 RepID=A0A7S0QIY4_9CRYP